MMKSQTTHSTRKAAAAVGVSNPDCAMNEHLQEPQRLTENSTLIELATFLERCDCLRFLLTARDGEGSGIESVSGDFAVVVDMILGHYERGDHASKALRRSALLGLRQPTDSPYAAIAGVQYHLQRLRRSSEVSYVLVWGIVGDSQVYNEASPDVSPALAKVQVTSVLHRAIDFLLE